MKIDNDFKNLLPELTAEEYTGLERDIVKHGILSPIIVWNDTIVDGHNRYRIAQAHRFTDSAIPTKEITFENKSQAIEWIINNQKSRRNLTKSQLVDAWSKWEAERAREAAEKVGGRPKKEEGKPSKNFNEVSDHIRTAAEVAAKIGVSEPTYRDMKLIKEHGTADQIARMDKGGKGNGVSAIAKEIKGKENEGTFRCSKCGKTFPLSMRSKGGYRNFCKSCNNEMERKSYDQKKNHSQYEEEFRAQHNERTFKYLQMELKSVVEASVHNIMDTIKDYESREILIDEESANSIHEILSALSKIVESVKERKND